MVLPLDFLRLHASRAVLRGKRALGRGLKGHYWSDRKQKADIHWEIEHKTATGYMSELRSFSGGKELSFPKQNSPLALLDDHLRPL